MMSPFKASLYSLLSRFISGGFVKARAAFNSVDASAIVLNHIWWTETSLDAFII